MDAQIVDRCCIVCGRPMTGTSQARRGRPQRTHPGPCKRRADKQHRLAKLHENLGARYLAWGAKTGGDNALTRRGNEQIARARALRARLGELPQDVAAEDTRSSEVLDRSRRHRLSLASNTEVHHGA